MMGKTKPELIEIDFYVWLKEENAINYSLNMSGKHVPPIM